MLKKKLKSKHYPEKKTLSEKRGKICRAYFIRYYTYPEKVRTNRLRSHLITLETNYIYRQINRQRYNKITVIQNSECIKIDHTFVIALKNSFVLVLQVQFIVIYYKPIFQYRFIHWAAYTSD